MDTSETVTGRQRGNSIGPKRGNLIQMFSSSAKRPKNGTQSVLTAFNSHLSGHLTNNQFNLKIQGWHSHRDCFCSFVKDFCRGTEGRVDLTEFKYALPSFFEFILDSDFPEEIYLSSGRLISNIHESLSEFVCTEFYCGIMPQQWLLKNKLIQYKNSMSLLNLELMRLKVHPYQAGCSSYSLTATHQARIGWTPW